jgi:RNA polymerase sigma factor for flagellar operon FliA
MTAEQRQLVLEHLGLARWTANKLAERLPVPYEDLLSDCHLGLCLAAERWDPDKGLAFPTYAAIRMRGAVIDNLRSRAAGYRTLIRDKRTIDHTYETLAQRHGREPSWQAVANELDWPHQRVDEARRLHAVQSPLPLDHRPRRGCTEDYTLEERIPGPDDDPASLAEVRDLLDSLPPKQRAVMTLTIGGVHGNAIANALGVHESLISHWKRDARDRLAAAA